MSTVGERLRELRAAKGLSQYDMSRQFQMPRSTYANYETGVREPDFDTVSKFADYFGVTTDYLLGRTDEPNAAPPEPVARLRELREAAGWSRQELAEKSGITAAVIAQYEAGTIEPAGHVLVRLSAALGVSTAYLRGKRDTPERSDHLPPDWEQVVEDAMRSGFSPQDVQKAIQMLRLALGQEGSSR